MSRRPRPRAPPPAAGSSLALGRRPVWEHGLPTVDRPVGRNRLYRTWEVTCSSRGPAGPSCSHSAGHAGVGVRVSPQAVLWGPSSPGSSRRVPRALICALEVPASAVQPAAHLSPEDTRLQLSPPQAARCFTSQVFLVLRYRKAGSSGGRQLALGRQFLRVTDSKRRDTLLPAGR